MAKMRSQGEALNDQALAAVGRVLTKRQLASYKKMRGEPFELGLLRPNGPSGRSPQGNRGTEKAADATPDNATPTEETPTADQSSPTADSPAAKSASGASTKTRTRRNSLREQRGLGGSTKPE
jgi:hypothetical protein